MQIPQSLFDDLMLETHNALATQCIKSLYDVDDFFLDDNRNLYTFKDYDYLNTSTFKLTQIIINTNDINLLEYIRDVGLSIFKTFVLYTDKMRIELYSDTTSVEKNIIQSGVRFVLPITATNYEIAIFKNNIQNNQ